MNSGYVYILSNFTRTVLYIGVTNDLYTRILQHRELNSGFTAKYKCMDLIHFEFFDRISDAIDREKQLKNWRREWKFDLIKLENPELKDLTDLI